MTWHLGLTRKGKKNILNWLSVRIVRDTYEGNMIGNGNDHSHVDWSENNCSSRSREKEIGGNHGHCGRIGRSAHSFC